MTKKPTRAELEAENKFLKRQKMASTIGPIVNHLITWVGLCVIAYFAYRSIDSLSGQQTDANIGVRLLAGIKLSDVFGYLFGGGGIVYGFRQKKLRQDTVERLQGRIKKFEQEKDPDRTSSGLTPRGSTHPKDI